MRADEIGAVPQITQTTLIFNIDFIPVYAMIFNSKTDLRG